MIRPTSIWLLISVALLAGCGADHPLPDVSGTYRNPCCSALTIANGTIETPSRTISFTLDEDKQGAILVPDKYLGVRKDQGLDVDANKSPLVLRYRADGEDRFIVVTGPDGDFAFRRDR